MVAIELDARVSEGGPMAFWLCIYGNKEMVAARRPVKRNENVIKPSERDKSEEKVDIFVNGGACAATASRENKSAG